MPVAMWLLRKITRDIIAANQENLSGCHYLPSLHLKMLRTLHLETSTGCSSNSQNRIYNLLKLLTFVFLFPQKCLSLNHLIDLTLQRPNLHGSPPAPPSEIQHPLVHPTCFEHKCLLICSVVLYVIILKK